jgi:isoleucyl-tRNA synthetase
VLRYTAEWERYVTRQARWVDFDDDYKTMDLPYMESVLWAFKTLWDKGLIYQAYRVMPYSWGAETPLSNFEIRLDDATRPRQDPALTVAFDLDPPRRPGAAEDPGVDHHAVDAAVQPGPRRRPRARLRGRGGRRRPLRDRGVRRPRHYAAELGEGHHGGHGPRADLVGRTYTPLFGYFADNPNSFRVLAGDFVDTAEGTGVVHLAPGFGEDDQRVCEAEGIELVVPVDEQGRFTAEVPEWAGVNVFEANPDIIRPPQGRGPLLRHETYDHNYPHCWRTDTPIIYRAMQSWYVRVTDLTDRLIETNQQINWIPDHVRDGAFGKWLGGCARLVDQPQPVLGRADPGVGERRPEVPPHRRVRQPRRDRTPTSACGPPTCTARSSTS